MMSYQYLCHVPWDVWPDVNSNVCLPAFSMMYHLGSQPYVVCHQRQSGVNHGGTSHINVIYNSPSLAFCTIRLMIGYNHCDERIIPSIVGWCPKTKGRWTFCSDDLQSCWCDLKWCSMYQLWGKRKWEKGVLNKILLTLCKINRKVETLSPTDH